VGRGPTPLAGDAVIAALYRGTIWLCYSTFVNCQARRITRGAPEAHRYMQQILKKYDV